jgi:hypothetical protein
MNWPHRILLFFAFRCMHFLASPAIAQEGPLENARPRASRLRKSSQRFAAKEKEFKEARDQYTYRQDIKVKTLRRRHRHRRVPRSFRCAFDDKGIASKT